MVSPFGLGPFRLFDVGGVVAIARHGDRLRRSAIRNTRALFDAERITRIAAVAFVLLGGGAGAGTAHAASPAPRRSRPSGSYVDATHARIQAERQRGRASAARPGRGHGRLGDGVAVAWRLDRRAGRARQSLARPHLRAACRSRDGAGARPPRRDAAAAAGRAYGPHRGPRPGPRPGALAITRSQLLTAHYDTEHDVHYTRLDAARVAADSVATRIREVGAPGDPAPRRIGASCGRCGPGGATKRCPAG